MYNTVFGCCISGNIPFYMIVRNRICIHVSLYFMILLNRSGPCRCFSSPPAIRSGFHGTVEQMVPQGRMRRRIKFLMNRLNSRYT